VCHMNVCGDVHVVCIVREFNHISLYYIRAKKREIAYSLEVGTDWNNQTHFFVELF
jgi:hypothetical protein